MSPFFTKKLDGYSRRFRHEYAMWSHRRRKSENQRRYEAWTRYLLEKPPDVLVGPDLSYGGVRGHVRAIQKYSSLNVALVPDERAMGGLDRFTEEIRERFIEFDPARRSCVHSHVMPWFIRWCRRQQGRGIAWVHTYHNMYFPEFGRDGLEPWQEEINDALIHEACHADIRLSVSRWQQDYLRNEHGIETDYLPNGVDVAACDKGNANRFRAKHRINGPFILWVGRNDPVKNPLDFVRLAEALPDVRFVMVGAGLTPETLPKTVGVSVPRNLTLTGQASHAEVQDALAACSLLVVTSKREGLPTLVLEGMAHMKPVVVPDEAGCLEAIGDGAFGLVYPQGSVPDLISRIKSVLASPPDTSLSRIRVLEEYDWRTVAPKLDAVYQSIFEGPEKNAKNPN
jgi:glycosyltransferase involved in cell wall biosynthesis